MGNNRKKGLVSDAYRVFTLPFRVPLFLGRARSDLDSKVNKKATGTLSALAINSSFSNDGEFLPRSIRLRKSTDIPTISAKSS